VNLETLRAVKNEDRRCNCKSAELERRALTFARVPLQLFVLGAFVRRQMIPLACEIL